MKTLGAIIKEYRTKNKLSMRRFAEAAQSTPAYISMLESEKTRGDGQLITPSLEKLTFIAKAMDMDVATLMAELGTEVNRDKAIEAGIIEAPSLSEDTAASAPRLEAFKLVPLTQENLNDALREGRLLILPFKVPKKGMRMFIPNYELDMVVTYIVSDVGGGIYTARAEMGTVQFSLYDIDRLIFTSYSAAKKMLETMKGDDEKKPAIMGGPTKQDAVNARRAYSAGLGKNGWGNDYAYMDDE